MSVLLPTRQRAGWAAKTIASVLSTCSRPENVEILVRADEDDPEVNAMIQLVSQLPNANRIKIFIGPRRMGYFSLHEFYNELCTHATGDWVMMFNDDATIETPNWDVILDNCEPDNPKVNSTVAMGHFELVQKDQDFVFPMVRRKAVQILGHLSLHAHNDAWLIYLYRDHRAFNCSFVVKGAVISHYCNSMTDLTRRETAAAQLSGGSMKNFHLSIPLIEKDQDILAKHL